LKDLWDLKAEIIKHNVGDKLELEIYRDGKIFTKTVELVDAPTGYWR
jgi:S1-C subfamily serine protease